MQSNSTRKHYLPFHPCRVITLDESQSAIYKSGYLDIVNSDGELLTSIGCAIDREIELFEREQAVDNLHLLEDLARSSGDTLELSSRGTLGLANAFWQAQRIAGES